MVLINSIKQVVLYNKYVFKHFNIEFPKKQEQRKLYTLDAKGNYKHFIKGRIDEKDYYNFRESIDLKKYLKYIKLNKNAKKLLDYLKKNKIKIAVATNRGNSTFLILKKFKIKKYFDVIITDRDIKKAKPHPDSINKAVKKLKLKKSEVLYVGDDIVDIEAGKRAKVKVALYGNKFKGADYYIKDLMKIEELLDS
ncbi:MAG: HAD-IA family hydrolase [Nanoarchaeota archaeon]|nr:HAD-IA family hydrolase [Nanoarchaeota archaeon]